MIEVFPKTIDETRARFDLQKLVGAFLSVAEDLAEKDGKSASDNSSASPARTDRALVLPPATPLVASNQPPQP